LLRDSIPPISEKGGTLSCANLLHQSRNGKEIVLAFGQNGICSSDKKKIVGSPVGTKSAGLSRGNIAIRARRRRDDMRPVTRATRVTRKSPKQTRSLRGIPAPAAGCAPGGTHRLPEAKLEDFTSKYVIRLGLETDCSHCQAKNWTGLKSADYEITCERWGAIVDFQVSAQALPAGFG
jgi:hypothetical protein